MLPSSVRIRTCRISPEFMKTCSCCCCSWRSTASAPVLVHLVRRDGPSLLPKFEVLTRRGGYHRKHASKASKARICTRRSPGPWVWMCTNRPPACRRRRARTSSASEPLSDDDQAVVAVAGRREALKNPQLGAADASKWHNNMLHPASTGPILQP